MTGAPLHEHDGSPRAALGFLAAGLVIGTAVGAGSALYLGFWPLALVPEATAVLPSSDDLLPAQPGSSLRIIQAVGLLLPLFVALLNVVDPASEFDVDLVSRSLLLGISSLVVGGGFAVVAGFLSDVTVVLKVSLLCLLVAFAFIGNAAMKLLPLDEPEPGPDDEESVGRGPAEDETADSEPVADTGEIEPESTAEDTEDTPQRDDGDAPDETEATEERTDGHTENSEQQL